MKEEGDKDRLEIRKIRSVKRRLVLRSVDSDDLWDLTRKKHAEYITMHVVQRKHPF